MLTTDVAFLPPPLHLATTYVSNNPPPAQPNTPTIHILPSAPLFYNTYNMVRLSATALSAVSTIGAASGE